MTTRGPMKAGFTIGQEGALIGVNFFVGGPPNGAVVTRNGIALSNDLWRSIRRTPSSAYSLACRLTPLGNPVVVLLRNDGLASRDEGGPFR